MGCSLSLLKKPLSGAFFYVPTGFSATCTLENPIMPATDNAAKRILFFIKFLPKRRNEFVIFSDSP
ncbi:hypothetical protein CWI74_10755 [Bacillus velezensis]|nr:hypothetical protein U722_14420 [Bacillus amyloliquefaciens LFB112]OQV42325.1 hypothetical protein B5M57_09870 [Bacillus velezensis]PAD04675.1 hypothetical protein CHH81_12435 [Bacillus velezensis]PKF81816.1 hypothetical protein CWI74_10755 [Bacillus velezensis]